MRNKQLRKFGTVEEVVSAQLCMGCGACIYACPTDAIKLIDIPAVSLRPKLDLSLCENCGKCVEICPGIEMSHQSLSSQTIPELRQAWGPVLEVWEGYASDPEIRYRGSSGGVTTAIALFCLEKEHMAGVLHIGPDPLKAWCNKSVISHDRSELLANAGSRYSPAAPCEKIGHVKEVNSPCVFIGKPCDVVALSKARVVDPVLDHKVGLSMGIFCAGTPTHKGTQALLKVLEVKLQDVEEIRYRGCGWPGVTSVKIKGNGEKPHMMSYQKAWGDILCHYGQFRCLLCPDSTGEFADISCGDPWYRKRDLAEPGRSLILVRTELGREILQKAIRAGYIEAEEVAPVVLSLSQRALLTKRRYVWGRLLAMYLKQRTAPHLKGFSLFINWWRLSIFDQIRSIVGTLRRINSRELE